MGQIQSVGCNLLPYLSTECILLPRYFTKFENYVPDPEYPHVDSSVRGSEGPVRIGYFSNVTEPSKAFVTACTTLGVPFCPDFKSATSTRGVNRVCGHPSSAFRQCSFTLCGDRLVSKPFPLVLPTVVKHITVNYMNERRTRVSAESAYLTKDVLARPNLVVALHAQVTKILFENDSGQARATGVEFSKSKNGPCYRAKSTKEVILS